MDAAQESAGLSCLQLHAEVLCHAGGYHTRCNRVRRRRTGCAVHLHMRRPLLCCPALVQVDVSKRADSAGLIRVAHNGRTSVRRKPGCRLLHTCKPDGLGGTVSVLCMVAICISKPARLGCCNLRRVIGAVSSTTTHSTGGKLCLHNCCKGGKGCWDATAQTTWQNMQSVCVCARPGVALAHLLAPRVLATSVCVLVVLWVVMWEVGTADVQCPPVVFC